MRAAWERLRARPVVETCVEAVFVSITLRAAGNHTGGRISSGVWVEVLCRGIQTTSDVIHTPARDTCNSIKVVSMRVRAPCVHAVSYTHLTLPTICSV
eukprot:2902207-Prymnesium_polylepis.1